MNKALKAYEDTITGLKDAPPFILFLAKLVVFLGILLHNEIFFCILFSIWSFPMFLFGDFNLVLFLISHFIGYTLFRILPMYKSIEVGRVEFAAMNQAIKDIKEVRRLTMKK